MTTTPKTLLDQGLIEPVNLDFPLTPTGTEPLTALVSHTLQVHLVRKGDIYYQKGRMLAKEVYRRVWNTECLVDGNDYGVIVEYNNEIVGNMNIQIGRENSPLKSEVFFQKEHWKPYFDFPVTKTVEISGLAIAEETPSEIRQAVLMLLIHGGFSLTKSLGIRFWSTIQHKMLYLMVTRRLGLPLFANQIITSPSANIPDDDYWRGSEPPQLYYLDLEDSQTIQTVNLFFCYLMMGNRIQFFPRFQSNSPLFASFRKMVS